MRMLKTIISGVLGVKKSSTYPRRVRLRFFLTPAALLLNVLSILNRHLVEERSMIPCE